MTHFLTHSGASRIQFRVVVGGRSLSWLAVSWELRLAPRGLSVLAHGLLPPRSSNRASNAPHTPALWSLTLSWERFPSFKGSSD